MPASTMYGMKGSAMAITKNGDDREHDAEEDAFLSQLALP